MNLVYRSTRRIAGQRQRWLSRLAVGTTSALTTTLCGLGAEGAAWVSTAPVPSWSHGRLSCRPLSSSATSLPSTTRTTLEKEMTRHALDIIHEAIRAVDPAQAVRSHFQTDGSLLKIGNDDKEQPLHLDDYEELVLVAFGKASSAMAATVLKQLAKDDNEASLSLPQCSGLVICKDDHGTPEELDLLSQHGIHVQKASHPVPDERSVRGAAALMELVKSRASERTLVVCCISGGGSALFCQPSEPLSLKDLQQVNSILLASGMGIQEMNVMRKRLEMGKGGRLAAACHPSKLVTLVLSDVLGDPFDLIASGPTVPDSSTWKDAWQIIQQYKLEDTLPKEVISMIRDGLEGNLPDSPSPDHPTFEAAKTVLVGNNALAVEAAANKAKALGYTPVVLGTQIEGEAKEIPHVYTAMALHLQQQAASSIVTCPQFSVTSSSLPVALIAGGETTVSMPTDSTGKGGRNQELALSAGLLLEKMDLRNVVLASVGTDGTDGPTDAAGAVVDATTFCQDLESAREALATHNAYPFLKRLGQLQNDSDVPPPLIMTGPTGTNVADICVTLVGSPPATK